MSAAKKKKEVVAIASPSAGPWSVSKYNDGTGDQLFIKDANRFFVAKIHPKNGAESEPEVRANARLIAAAPELLEALEYALAVLAQPATKRMRAENSITDIDLTSIEREARAAIAKARGEKP